jgi:hypothetical protein
MKLTVFPLPFVGFAFRFEILRVQRKLANGHKRPVLKSKLLEALKREVSPHEVSPHIVRDIGIDRSRSD